MRNAYRTKDFFCAEIGINTIADVPTSNAILLSGLPIPKDTDDMLVFQRVTGRKNVVRFGVDRNGTLQTIYSPDVFESGDSANFILAYWIAWCSIYSKLGAVQRHPNYRLTTWPHLYEHDRSEKQIWQNRHITCLVDKPPSMKVCHLYRQSQATLSWSPGVGSLYLWHLDKGWSGPLLRSTQQGYWQYQLFRYSPQHISRWYRCITELIAKNYINLKTQGLSGSFLYIKNLWKG